MKHLMVGAVIVMLTMFTGSLVYANAMNDYNQDDYSYSQRHRGSRQGMMRQHQRMTTQMNHCHDSMDSNGYYQ